ncbi:MAG: YihY/virulence factor BrkB family protein [Ferruginibacter sp.]|nr:YihY/virulence factor BrkB family protein [Bacteroidota bacterium]MBX2919628.1 YihY/virulence factor BrkB family protein [Ferruginibacter sp.]MCB0708487.1 YihY/virulence factor BrkB family protein [Chitinophagaceae bacterium]MCC7378332.1 YihY/virulence factor BrkB family protein [Chitinophagaceae bacterium]
MTKIERILITKTPLAFILNKSKHWYLPGFEGVPLYDVARFFYRQIKTVGLTERASAIAYNFIMAIPPSFLFLFTLVPNLPFIKKREIMKQLSLIIKDIIPAEGYNKDIIKFIDDTFFRSPVFSLLSFGLLLALFFASNAMMGLMRSFNKNYIGFEKRKGLMNRWIAIRLTSLIFGLVLGCLILLITQSAFLKWMGLKSIFWISLISYIRWIFIIALVFYSIAFIYKYAPAVQKRWRLISPGAILATFLCIMASLGFSYFVNNFGRYNALYGSIGSIIVLMALIFINSLALLIGFELNVSIKSLKTIAEEREKQEKMMESETGKTGGLF